LPVSQWRSEELAGIRARLAAESAAPIPLEPTLPDVKGGSVRAFFEALAEVVGERGVYVADAGLHQALTRRYARVLRPRGLLSPSDFQSMGFGLPGAIGAAVASPQAQVVACIGDAGLALSMGDLLTAAREGLSLVVVVFNDGQMSLIRRQQLTNYGHDSGVAVANPDYGALAQAVGCSYFPVTGDPAEVARCSRRAASGWSSCGWPITPRSSGNGCERSFARACARGSRSVRLGSSSACWGAEAAPPPSPTLLVTGRPAAS